jgi:hypothetical protein
VPERPPGPLHGGDERSGGVDIRDAEVTLTHGDIIGRDQYNFITQLINLPLSTRIAVVVMALALVAAVALVATTQADTLLRFTRGADPMTGDFNIAVAAFGQVGQDGRIESSTDGETLSRTITDGIRKEVTQIPNVNPEVRHDGVPLIREQDPVARETQLRDLARGLNADLIIFGELAGSGASRTVQPSFYVRSGARGAEEILGSNHLGTPVGAPEDLSRVAPSATLRTRIDALTRFTLGLEALIQKDASSAVTWFDRAVNTADWKDKEGKEIAYLFLGTAYKARGNAGDLDRALEAYTTSARLNEQYARAYIGQGNVYYQQYDELRRSGQQRPELLDQALAAYEQAEGAADKPNTALVEGKIHVTTGNVYLVKAQSEESASDFRTAEQQFLWVLDQYAAGAADMRELVPRAYFGLGVVYERGYADQQQAASFYQQCLATAQSDEEIAASARAQLAAIARQQ